MASHKIHFSHLFVYFQISLGSRSPWFPGVAGNEIGGFYAVQSVRLIFYKILPVKNVFSSSLLFFVLELEDRMCYHYLMIFLQRMCHLWKAFQVALELYYFHRHISSNSVIVGALCCRGDIS